LNWYLY